MSSEYKGAACPVCHKSFDDCKHSLDEARNYKANKSKDKELNARIRKIVIEELDKLYRRPI